MPERSKLRRTGFLRIRTVVRVLAPVLVLSLVLVAACSGGPEQSGSQLAEVLTRPKRVAGLSALALLLVTLLLPRNWNKLRTTSCILAAVFGLTVYYNFGSFRAGTFQSPQFVHYLEQMHYHLGSKYFRELGYDGLYAASVQAQRESAPRRPIQPLIRDLRFHLRYEPTRPSNPHLAAVQARFSPERWASFVADHRHYQRALDDRGMTRFRRDHGYNAPPTWTFVAQLLAGRLSPSPGVRVLLGSLDLLLLAVAFGAIFTTYGMRIGCLSVVLFGLGYGWHFRWIGGAFWRFDWLAAVSVGVCLLKRGRPAIAGALLGYASLVRIFPLFFLLGPAVLAVKGLVRGRRPAWLAPLAAGFGIAIVLGLVAGSLSGRGFSAWSEFAHKIRLHEQTWGRNHIGLESALLFAPRLVQAGDTPVAEISQEELRELRRDRLWIRMLIVGGLLGLLVLAQWRNSLADASLLGMVAVFALIPLSCYYWAMLLLVPLRRGTPTALLFLLLSAVLFTADQLHAVSDPALRYVWVSSGLAPLLALWILPDALRTLRKSKAGPPTQGDPTIELSPTGQ